MKRSEINHAIADAKAFFKQVGFALPEFAHWTTAQWKQIGTEADEIRKRRLGWAVIDFGPGDFATEGITQFTLRRGSGVDHDGARPYCERVGYLVEKQLVPFHYHKHRAEDLINRGGGVIEVELFNVGSDGQKLQSPVFINADGVIIELPPGGLIELNPGESVALMPMTAHQFRCRPGSGPVAVGEVCGVSEHLSDTHFLEPRSKPLPIDEDEPPIHYLADEYPGKAS